MTSDLISDTDDLRQEDFKTECWSLPMFRGMSSEHLDDMWRVTEQKLVTGYSLSSLSCAGVTSVTSTYKRKKGTDHG